MSEQRLPTRKEFLQAVAGSTVLAQNLAAQQPRGKLLIVAAHPDDEYAFAAATYRLVRESGWLADQVVITNGESGYRYSALAETYYGVSLGPTPEGRAHLAEIRKKEARGAGQVLGIRNHYFLEQRDLGFDRDAASAQSGNWDRPYIAKFLAGLLSKEKYDAIFTLLPAPQTHGHHREAALLALEAVSHLAVERPLIFGVEAHDRGENALQFSGLPAEPITRTMAATPVLVFDRATSLGYRDSLNYRIVVNWLIAEHKSQGLFQNDFGKDQFEQFWLFEASGENSQDRLSDFQRLFSDSGAPG
jgi:LmbE family N-acetylglucosaminyl deacetylase